MLTKLRDVGLTKCRGWFLNFSEAPLIFQLKKNIFFPVNANITRIAAVIRLILYLNSWQAFHTIGVPFFMCNQSEEGSIVYANRRKALAVPSSRPTISTSVNTTWRSACILWSVQELRRLS
jgi:hypothetical protein